MVQGGAVSRGYEERGVPLTEGGLRYTIHPVTGQLLTSEVQCMSPDMGTSPHRPHREDRSIIKACHYSSLPPFLILMLLFFGGQSLLREDMSIISHDIASPCLLR